MAVRLPCSASSSWRCAVLRSSTSRHLHTTAAAAAASAGLLPTTTPPATHQPGGLRHSQRYRPSLASPSTVPPSSPCPRRPYHSYDHPTPETPFSPAESAILAAAYAHIPAHGFTQEALAAGARDAGYLDISTNVLPHGVFSLVQWHLVSQREALARRAEELFVGRDGEDKMPGVGRKVDALVWERLMGNAAIIGRWQEALAIMAQPSYVPESVKELAKLSDEIWFLIGDKSVDSSWYTKRASLSAVYASTELFMTSDKSEGFAETKKFLRRRMGEVQDIGGSLRSVGQWVGFTASAGLNVLRSKGMRI